MLKISYTLSESIQKTLQRIEILRRDLILTPMQPKIELRMRWETLVTKIYWILTLAKNPISKKDIILNLYGEKSKKQMLKEKSVLQLRNAFSYIKENWLNNPKNLNISAFVINHDKVCPGRGHIDNKQILELITYIESVSENPVIAAAIIYAMVNQILALSSCCEKMSFLSSFLYLDKHAYDFRGLISIEEYFGKDEKAYRQALDKSWQNGNLTPFIEFFCQAVADTLFNTLGDLKDSRFQTDLPQSFWELSDRQKKIIEELDIPSATATNKKVQMKFKVSQVTASRDLAKLASFGLIFAHGKGRSVYYTKV